MQPSQSEEASEASDEEESSWKWSELSPLVLTAALPEGVPSRELCTRLRWVRLFWWLALLVFYASVLLLASTDRLFGRKGALQRSATRGGGGALPRLEQSR